MNADDYRLMADRMQRGNDQLAAALGVIEKADALVAALLAIYGTDPGRLVSEYRAERRVFTLLVESAHTSLDSLGPIG